MKIKVQKLQSEEGNEIIISNSEIEIDGEKYKRIDEISDEKVGILKNAVEVRMGDLENQRKSLNKSLNISLGLNLVGIGFLVGMAATTGVAKIVLGSLSVAFNVASLVNIAVEDVKNIKIESQLKSLRPLNLVLERELYERALQSEISRLKEENEALYSSENLEDEDIENQDD